MFFTTVGKIRDEADLGGKIKGSDLHVSSDGRQSHGIKKKN